MWTARPAAPAPQSQQASARTRNFPVSRENSRKKNCLSPPEAKISFYIK